MTCLRPDACMKVPSKDAKRKTSPAFGSSYRKRDAFTAECNDDARRFR